MKFNLKTLVAAVALAAVAGQAAAALPASTATTPSDVIFFAIDATANTSFMFDLGAVSNLSSLNQNITGAAWTSYLAAESNSLANTTWGIAYSFGDSALSSLIGTTVTSGSVIDAQDASSLSGARVAFNSFLGATAMTGVGTSVYNGSTGNGNYNVLLANSFGGNFTSFTVDNAVGTPADFFAVTTANSANGGQLVVSGITFNGVTVAAVPEPETYSMLFAGLMMIGAIARRRKV